MAFPLIIRICHWQKRLFALCSFSPFSFRITFFEEKRSFSWCLQLPPISVQSLAITRIFGIDFLVGLFSSGFGRSLKIPRRNNRAGSSPATGTTQKWPLYVRWPLRARPSRQQRSFFVQTRNRWRWIAGLFFLKIAPYSTNPRLAARIDARRGVSSFQNRNRSCGLRFCFWAEYYK